MNLQRTNQVSDIRVNWTVTGVESLFNKINCDRGAIDDMLGAQAGVSDQNMIQYLGIIEQRTNELLAVRDYQQSKVIILPMEISVSLSLCLLSTHR